MPTVLPENAPDNGSAAHPSIAPALSEARVFVVLSTLATTHNAWFVRCRCSIIILPGWFSFRYVFLDAIYTIESEPAVPYHLIQPFG